MNEAAQMAVAGDVDLGLACSVPSSRFKVRLMVLAGPTFKAATPVLKPASVSLTIGIMNASTS